MNLPRWKIVYQHQTQWKIMPPRISRTFLITENLAQKHRSKFLTMENLTLGLTNSMLMNIRGNKNKTNKKPHVNTSDGIDDNHETSGSTVDA